MKEKSKNKRAESFGIVKRESYSLPTRKLWQICMWKIRHKKARLI